MSCIAGKAMLTGSVLTCIESITAGLPSLRQLPSIDIRVYEGVVRYSRGLQACISHLLHDAWHCCHAPSAAVALQQYVEDAYVCRDALLLHVLYERPGLCEFTHRDAGIHSCSRTQPIRLSSDQASKKQPIPGASHAVTRACKCRAQQLTGSEERYT